MLAVAGDVSDTVPPGLATVPVHFASLAVLLAVQTVVLEPAPLEEPLDELPEDELLDEEPAAPVV